MMRKQTGSFRLGVLAALCLVLVAVTLPACTRDRPVADEGAAWTQTPGATGQQAAPAATPGAGAVGQGGELPTGQPAPGGDATTLPIATPPPAVATIPAPIETWSYVVQEGDTLSDIAQRFGVDVNVLVTLNNLKDAGDIRAGQVIKIPGTRPNDVILQPNYITHTVQRGETLGVIAQRYGTTIAELMRINSISNPNLIHPGQVLKVPNNAGSSSGSNSGEPRIYIVRRGDTLSQIAARYGVTVATIAAANGIKDPSKIVEGQRLVIP